MNGRYPRHHFDYQHQNVVCVSGDELLTDELCQILRKLRFRTQTATGLAAALEIVDRRPPALLIIDFNLADASGLELLQRLRSGGRGERVPVLMLATPFQAEHYRTHLLGPAPQGWLHKPVDEDRLAAAVTQWVGVEIRGARTSGEDSIDTAKALPDEGAFSELPFARVLVLAGRRGDGRLVIQRADQWLRIWLRGATIVGLSSSYIDNCTLGQLLTRRGRIGRQTLREATMDRRPGQRLGEWLIERGLIDAEELAERLRDQIVHKITSAFSWRWYDAHWSYEPPANPADIHVACDIPVRQVIFGGIAKYYDRDRLEMIFTKRGRLRRRIIPTTPFVQEFPIPARRLLNAADGGSTPAQVRDRAGMEVLRFYQTLYALWVLDLARFGDPVDLDPKEVAFENENFRRTRARQETTRRH